MLRALVYGSAVAWTALSAGSALAGGPRDGFCTADPAAAFTEIKAETGRRMVCADVAALDQTLVYNRFGAHDPYGMIFALTRDLVPADRLPAVGGCEDDIGVRPVQNGLAAGNVRVRDCKRPRPLALRANVGDVLMVRVHNYLRPETPDYSRTFCGSGVAPVEAVSKGTDGKVEAIGDKLVAALCPSQAGATAAADEGADWPATRGVSFVIDGLRPLSAPGRSAPDPVCMGLGQLPPGTGYVDCYWHAEREGPYFVNSIAAPSGGAGDGGSLTHGLFGSLVIEPRGEGGVTRWYRSQVSSKAFDRAWPSKEDAAPHARDGALNYAATMVAEGETLPVLDLLKQGVGNRHELVHNDLNAIVAPAGKAAFREFTVMFHDELKTFHTRNFAELDRFPQLAGVRDGFGINYGSSGLGSLLIANRKGIGPAADCPECLYEEFFLESWANGDPALLEAYDDDPSNVHHSYLNDAVVFRNFHAGPKETHVFHLHAHQWFGGNDSGRGGYLDSQTVAPRQGFTYKIYRGGPEPYEGSATADWWEQGGSGNRNRTVGDSIFHCHLYPHFAQGMWELWRVHDVLEDGSRLLPDGQPGPGLSTELMPRAADGALDPIAARGGTVGPRGTHVSEAEGTPVPGLVPLPGRAAPVLPTYVSAADAGGDGWKAVAAKAVVGYPFFVAGVPGHRAPQPPLDIALDADGQPLDGGLPRHVVLDGSERELGVAPTRIGDLGVKPDDDIAARRPVEDALYRYTAKMLALGDFSGHLTTAKLDILEADGEPLEKAAMTFHHNGAGLSLLQPDGNPSQYDAAAGGYRTLTPATVAGYFPVNGAPPKPGAPFADPCGAPDIAKGKSVPRQGMATADGKAWKDPFTRGDAPWAPDPALTGFRRYEASAVQVDLVTNRAGWHDPQGRINVLSSRPGDAADDGYRRSDSYKNLGPSAREVPFFFRAFSGECIEFRHTNELPKELELDDFQVKTPTDTIGQHIHLVKFDVTSADGSGNGWNYEDGTFAADEIASRLCAVLDPKTQAPKPVGVEAGTRVAAMSPDAWNDLCVRKDGRWKPKRDDLWRDKLGGAGRARFQTTVQRWFADPILAPEASGGSAMADRTLRTVFTHDHFGPSSIQQHGFYSALVIEPAGKKVSPGQNGKPETAMETAVGTAGYVEGGPGGVGVHKIVRAPDGGTGKDEIHPDYREFALAVADFALLYDPTDGDKDDLRAAAGKMPSGADLGPADDGRQASPSGLATLVCEAERRDGAVAGLSKTALERLCGSTLRFDLTGSRALIEDADVPPSVVARDMIDDPEVRDLRRRFALVRFRAGFGEGFARPVNAPNRPEAISTDHHDPYLVNYRGEPIPLRIGDTGAPEADEAKELVEPESHAAAPEGPERLWQAGAGDAEPVAAPIAADGGVGPARTAEECFADRTSAAGILGQFRRRAPVEPSSAGKIAPPGAAEASTDAVQGVADASTDAVPDAAMAAVAAAFDCSIDRQRPDDRGGDLADAYRSRMDDGVGHGDPVTPLLETYSEERVQIRLIQGAQEVQHTFNIEGLQWRRMIDQSFPSQAQQLDDVFALQTWWGDCRKTFGLSGNARQHERWRSGTLTSGDDLAYWKEHGTAVARCDNLEGFVAAQEVGISEHFEIPSVPSKYAVGFRFVENNKPAGLDYLYHFGSQDAVWNGAWGLMRVYEPGDTKDITSEIECQKARTPGETCPASATIGQVLEPVAPSYPELAEGRGEVRLAERKAAERKALVPMPMAAQPPQPASCPNGAPVIAAYAVAISLPGGQSFASWGNRLVDRNALALVPVREAVYLDWLAQRGADPKGALRRLQRAALAAYGDEPGVIRANAGDCLRLSIVNAMTSPDDAETAAARTARVCGHGPNGDPGAMTDCLGDAPMPRIVPLNVEPGWGERETEAELARGPVERVQQDAIDVRPSARMAMLAPLPMLTRGEDSFLPFGANGKSIAAPGEVQTSTYYLGLLRVDWTVIDAMLESKGMPGGSSAINGLQLCRQEGLSGPPPDTPAAAAANDILSGLHPDAKLLMRTELPPRRAGGLWAEPLEVELLGSTWYVTVAPLSATSPKPDAAVIDAVRQMAPACFAALIAKPGVARLLGDTPILKAQPSYGDAAPVSGIPYAFGPAPLKPVVDIFNQLPHGLLGAIVVEPEKAAYGALRRIGANGRGVYEPPAVKPDGLAHRGRGANTLLSLTVTGADGAESLHPVREFVLFYRDGLNLWDSDSRNAWWPRGGGGPLRIVDDCRVCDDSYDLGEKAVGALAPAFNRRLSEGPGPRFEAHNDLNAARFPPDFRHMKDSLSSNPLRLWAKPGEDVVIRVVDAGGRARQRAFVTVGNDYDDLFPGFGFPHAALLAPGKSLTAALSQPVRKGCYLWSDGPREIEASGAWGLLDVLTEKGASSCGFHD